MTCPLISRCIATFDYGFQPCQQHLLPVCCFGLFYGTHIHYTLLEIGETYATIWLCIRSHCSNNLTPVEGSNPILFLLNQHCQICNITYMPYSSDFTHECGMSSSNVAISKPFISLPPTAICMEPLGTICFMSSLQAPHG